jgi:hypothetical protein
MKIDYYHLHITKRIGSAKQTVMQSNTGFNLQFKFVTFVNAGVRQRQTGVQLKKNPIGHQVNTQSKEMRQTK